MKLNKERTCKNEWIFDKDRFCVQSKNPRKFSYIGIRVDELRACIASECVDDNHLAPFLNIYQEVAQLAVVLVDQICAFRAYLFKCLNGTSCHQLKNRIKI